ncbi:hypothetical protein [Propionivibrio soli]|uniref:hypothetical protein n=1 Tax=Propionivibrio soli TaxID=2976531 RepID=UPI0021E964B9|nr:hypothetical protein [Propionivibrio soli]
MKCLIGVFLLVFVTGCGSLPDAKPFAEATGTMSGFVKASGQALTDSLRDEGSLLPENKTKYEDDIKKFDTAWEVRIKAVEGAVAYSNAIADVIAAAGETRETINKVADSLSALAGATGIALPTAPIIGVAKDIGEFLAARIATVRASHKLEEALAQAQPAVDKIAENLVRESNGELKPILEDVHKNILSAINSTYGADDDFAGQLKRLLLQARTEALRDLSKASALQEIDRMGAVVSARLKERDQKRDQAAAAYKARLQLVNGLSTATLAWAAAHRDLAAAIKEKRKVSTAELQATIIELRELIKKVRAL